MDYYYSQLNNGEKRAYNDLLAGLIEEKESITANGISTADQASACLCAVQYDHPELLHFNMHHYRCFRYPNCVVIYPEYLYSREEAEEIRKKVDAVVQRIIFEISRRGITGVYRKCWFIHWYLVKNCTYDREALTDPEGRPFAWTVEGPFLKNTAVCLGIALAFMLVCKRCGISCIVAKGVSLEPGKTEYEPHAWNMVFSGTEAVQIDVTWDMCLTDKEDPPRYDYFFLPDIDMMRDHQYTNYPYCRKMKATWFESTGTYFNDLESLEKYVTELLKKSNVRKTGDVVQLHCRLANRKESYDAVWDVVSKTVVRVSGCSCKGTLSTNRTQSVISYRIVLT